VFSFGIILYELLSGVVVASRVAMQGEHDELLDYARQVANGHREALPTHWPVQVRKVMMATLGHVALFFFCPMSVFAVYSRLCVCLTPAGDMLSCNCGDVCMYDFLAFCCLAVTNTYCYMYILLALTVG
jgi:hypothetical protein